MKQTQPKTQSQKYYRLALYDPCEPDEEPEFHGPVFADSRDDHLAMADIIRRYNLLAENRQYASCLAAFPVDQFGTPLEVSPASKWRTFYRMALMDPRKLEGERPGGRLKYFGPAFEDTPRGRRVMKFAIQEWLKLRKPKHRYAVVLLKFQVIDIPGKRRRRLPRGKEPSDPSE